MLSNQTTSTGTWQEASPRRVPSTKDGIELFKTLIIEGKEGAAPSPNGYLVEQKPFDIVRAHFHFNSQFQVIVMGSGSLGRHPVEPFIVQYVAAQTGYGPITAGATGIAYLTLRKTTIANGGAQYLPENRVAMTPDLPRRQVMSSAVSTTGRHDAFVQRSMIEPEATGLAAWLLQVPSDQTVWAPRHDGGTGRFYVVAGGELVHEAERLSRFGMVWQADSDAPFEITSGPAGLDLLIMQFPLGSS
jgi:hypothetical protein